MYPPTIAKDENNLRIQSLSKSKIDEKEVNRTLNNLLSYADCPPGSQLIEKFPSTFMKITLTSHSLEQTCANSLTASVTETI